MISWFEYLNNCVIGDTVHKRAVSSVGRATCLHQEGHRFESCTAHLVFSAPARNRTSNSGLEVRSYIHLTTGANPLIVLEKQTEVHDSIHRKQ